MTATHRVPHSRPGHLDARSPLVLDTRELGRRPGSMREMRRSFDAPSGWELALVAVPPGSPVDLDLRLESVMDGVLVTGTITAPVRAECGRCLEPVEDSIEVGIQELFVYDPQSATEDTSAMQGDLVDLEPLVRDAVVLGLPVNPVCTDECAGLCAECGVRLDSVDDDHSHETLDPRWSVLAGLGDGEPGGSDEHTTRSTQHLKMTQHLNMQTQHTTQTES